MIPFRENQHKPAAGSIPEVSVHSIVGVSPWVRGIRQEILRVAAHSADVLITGPTGTGKELIARAIHAHCPRADGPFIAVDCAAVNGTLFAGQMFGHVKGAFTGADQPAPGYFRAADGGTIFLDEISELEPPFQAMLLRVLQRRCVTPLGSHEEIPVDVRVIAATNCDLEEMVCQKRFRQDLYYRVNVISLKSVALKERPEDIEILAEHFLARQAAQDGIPRRRISSRCLECLRSQDWPGNVRELENFLQRATLLKGDGEIDLTPLLRHGADVPHRPGCLWTQPPPSDLTADGGGSSPNVEPPCTDGAGPWPDLAQAECEHILRTLQRTAYNQTAAARLLKIPRKQLVRKIKIYRIDVSRSRPGRPAK
jgi:DNA-binding NtrC family response regulator